MKTTLGDLTMSQYIDLLCGDLSVIAHGDGITFKRERIRRDIILEYQEICDKTTAGQYLVKGRRHAKAKALCTLFSICKTLLENGYIEPVRCIMDEAGVRTRNMTDQRVKAEVLSRLAKAEREIKESGEQQSNDDNDEKKIRLSFDRQTAMLMSHFKFQIDLKTIKATIYASLVDQCTREIKAQNEALTKTRRR